MRVILLEDIENMGAKYDIKEVKDGYARNFLIPKKLVKLATDKNLKWLEIQKEIKARESKQDLEKAQGTATKIDGLEIIIPVKVGEENQLFESINAQKIADKIKELGFEVKKTQILLEEPIKEAGEFPVKIKFEHNLEAEVRVIITEEKN